MGYCIQQHKEKFQIKASNVPLALAAIKRLADRVGEGGGGTFYMGERTNSCFSWVTTEEFVKAETLKEAMKAWRYEIETMTQESFDKQKKGDNTFIPYNGMRVEVGDVFGIYFEGEKYGDDMILLNAISPYVEVDSYIEMSGEDGCIWRWVFDGENCEEKHAKISW